MAINLWKLGSKPTSYNPLPVGWNNSIRFNQSIVISFKAKSPSGAILKVLYQNVGGQNITLTNELKLYSVTIDNPTQKSDLIYIYDNDSQGDIIIENIQLVQKPLPKLTINGIDGFLSGKWTLHANTSVVDDTKISVNNTTAWRENKLTVNTEIGKTYTFSHKDSNHVVIRKFPGTDNSQDLTSGTGNLTFVAQTTQTIILLSSPIVGMVAYDSPMLNLGSIPAPYEKKRGERMVLPTPKGNLFDGYSEAGSIDTTTSLDIVNSLRKRSGYIPVKPNTNYTLSCDGSIQLFLHEYELNKNPIGGYKGEKSIMTLGVKSVSFTTSNNAYFVRLRNNDNQAFNPIMFNEGNVPQPFTPYAVQVNKKPKRYVPIGGGKNLLPTQPEKWIAGNVDGTNGSFLPATTRLRIGDFINVVEGEYFLSLSSQFELYGYKNGVYVSKLLPWSNSRSVTIPNTVNQIIVTVRHVDGVTNIDPNYITTVKPQLEKGNIATVFEEYRTGLPKAKTGQAFNGTTDYLQLPSMTMDSIEIDCLIDSSNNTNNKLLDARTGLTNGHVAISSIGNGWTQYFENSVEKSRSSSVLPTNQRVKLKFLTNTPFTDDLTIFAHYTGIDKLKGTLYKVTCYLAGQVVAQYDFENPSNIVGDKVIQNAKNLIPSFEDTRWSLHSNFKVLGKDVGRLEATGANQNSFIDISVRTSTSYRLDLGKFANGQISHIYFNGVYKTFVTNFPYSFVTDSDTTTIRLYLFSNSTGTFDFIQPKLYELTGKEGTLFGKPSPLKKASKRSLTSKR